MRIATKIAALLIAVPATWLFATEPAQTVGFTDGIDRSDPNFVTASLLWIGPGNEFFGCAGHSSIRLECPAYNLDYCFSCESESICENFGRFIMGGLKTGMFAIPTPEFLKLYEAEGRGATQYRLNLPSDVKQRLWQILDNEVKNGRCLPYDYIKYCCVQTMLRPLLDAIKPYEVKFAPWPEKFKLTRRERLAVELDWCKWTGAFLELIAGIEVDREVDNLDRVILSEDFVEMLKGATIDGIPIITSDGEPLLPYKYSKDETKITPTMVAGLLVLIAAINLFLRSRMVDMLFLAFQSILGVFLFHLLFISSLPATGWNWLFVLFNPLPFILWKWRRYWAVLYVCVLLAWEGYMLLASHRLTGPAYLVLVAAYIIMYARIGISAPLAIAKERGLA